MRVPSESSPRERIDSEPPPIEPVLRSLTQTKSLPPQFVQEGGTVDTYGSTLDGATVKTIAATRATVERLADGRRGATEMYRSPLRSAVTPVPLNRITVALDGSPNSAAAFDYAIDLAKHYGSSLVILAIAPLVPVYVTSGEPYVPTAVPESELARYREIVETAIRTAESAGLTSVTGVCDEGVIVDEILSHLEEHPTDLLVVGSRGLSTARRILLGSVSTALVNHAPCPVLVVRPAATTPAR